MFILSDTAIKAIKETPGLKATICLALEGISEQTLNRHLVNEPNNDITKYAALDIINQVTGISIGRLVKKIPNPVLQT